jgi:hypothetical protein
VKTMSTPAFAPSAKLPQTGGKHRSNRECFETQPTACRPYKHPVRVRVSTCRVLRFLSRAALNCPPAANTRDWGSTGTLRGMARQAAINLKIVKCMSDLLPHTSANHLSHTCLRRAEALSHRCERSRDNFSRLQTHEASYFTCRSFLNALVSSDPACVVTAGIISIKRGYQIIIQRGHIRWA